MLQVQAQFFGDTVGERRRFLTVTVVSGVFFAWSQASSGHGEGLFKDIN